MNPADSILNVRKGSNFFNENISAMENDTFCSVLSLAGKTKIDYYTLEGIVKKNVDASPENPFELIKLTVENSKGLERSVILSKSQQVYCYGRKQYWSVLRINKLDVFLDDEGLLNKLKKVEVVKYEKPIDLYSASVKFGNGYFLNGILIR